MVSLSILKTLTSGVLMQNEISIDTGMELKPRAKRLNLSKAARIRRKRNKIIVAEVLERRYARNRRIRKNK